MNKFIRNMMILLAVTVVLSGCVATGEKKPNGGADTSQTRTEGALLGVVVGGLIGALSGDNKKERLKRAMIGATVGGLAGLAIGDLMAKRQQGYATREAAIKTETQIVRRHTEELHAQNQKLAQDIRDYDQQIQNLNTDYARLQAQKEIVATRHQEAQSLLTLVRNELTEANRQVQNKYQQNQVSASDLKKWETQVANLEKEKDALQKNVDTLFSMTQSL